MKTNGKKIISKILSESRDWHNANDSKPDVGKEVVIRLMNPNAVYAETETEIHIAEDIKVGKFIRDINDPEKGEWVISPPYPKYDYSPLSRNEKIHPNAHVTHWAEVGEEELASWKSRFEPQGEYTNLDINIDPEFEEEFYKGLLNSANRLNMTMVSMLGDKEYPVDENKLESMRRAVQFFDDAQACIDIGIAFVNGKKVRSSKPDTIASPEEIQESILEKIDMMDQMLLDRHVLDVDFLHSVIDRLTNVISNMSGLIESGIYVRKENK